ncbi:MAG: hypothetical protein QNJ54_19660 [Prochloraceae cyanobacterium]|nr:hypothetical protein [Prochloraceae cyanobacterium]
MSPNSNGFYKSKFFNFINRKSQNLANGLQITFRHIGIAVKWGLQIALYPVYLLVQTGRFTGHQFNQKQIAPGKEFTASVPTLQDNTSLVLAPVKGFLHVMSWVQNSPLAIAANLFGESKAIAPAGTEKTYSSTPNNDRPKKTEELFSQRKEVEVVTPLNSRLEELKKQLQTNDEPSNTPSAATISAPLDLEPEVRPEVRPEPKPEPEPEPSATSEFLQSAISFLKGKTEEEKRQAEEEIQPSRSDNITGGALVLVGRQRTGKIVPLLKQYSALVLVSTEKFTSQLTERIQTTVETVKTNIKTTQDYLLSEENLETNRAKFETAFRNTVDYVLDGFEKRSGRVELKGNSAAGIISARDRDYTYPQNDELPKQEQSETSLENTQFSSKDMLEDVVAKEDTNPQSNSPQPKIEKPLLSKLELKSSLLGNIQRNLNDREESKSLEVSQALGTDSATLETPDGNLGINLSQEGETDVKSAPDWLETNATSVGYVKHPLETLLEWLDTIVLKIEQLIGIVWNWLQEKIAKITANR